MPTIGQELVIKDDRIGVNIFGGYIKDITTKFLTPDVTVAICSCQDYTKLITDVPSGVTADYSAGALTEKAILTALFAAYCPTITVGAHVITGALAAINFSDSSLQRAIEELAIINDRKWFVDYDKELHYFTAGDELAPFDLSDAPDESLTFGYANLEHTIDIDNLERVTLKCWQPGLFAGQTVGITNATLGWTDKQLLITNVITNLLARNDKPDYPVDYQVTLGTIPKQRFTDEVIRSGRVITTARIADLAVTNAKIDSCSISKLTAGTITADMTISSTLQTAASPNARMVITSAGIKAYDATNVQRAQILNDGSGWFGASGDFSWTNAGVVSINGVRLQNTSVADAAIGSCSWGKLTVGSLTAIGTITTGKLVTGAAGANRIEITSALIAGYNAANALQFYLQASDGKAYCGAGAVVLDSVGILLDGSISDTNLRFKYGTDIGYIWIGSGGDLHISVPGNKHLYIVSQGGFGHTITGDISPSSNVFYELGDTSYYWKSVYARDHVIGGGAASAITGCLFYDTDPSIGIYVNGGWHWKHLEDD